MKTAARRITVVVRHRFKPADPVGRYPCSSVRGANELAQRIQARGVYAAVVEITEAGR